MEQRDVNAAIKGNYMPVPEDITSSDGYTEAQYLAKNASDQSAANKAAAATCTTTTPGPKAKNIG